MAAVEAAGLGPSFLETNYCFLLVFAKVPCRSHPVREKHL